MNTDLTRIQQVLTDSGFDINKLYDVEVKGKNRRVTPLGHNVKRMVSRMDLALIMGMEHLGEIVDYIENDPVATKCREAAPKRKSPVDTKSLIKSLSAHVSWLTGTANKGRFIQQFVDVFGNNHKRTANLVSKEIHTWAELHWRAQAKAAIKRLSQPQPEDAATAALQDITDEMKSYIDIPDVETIEVVALESGIGTCQGETATGNPCKNKAADDGYCTIHRKMLANQTESTESTETPEEDTEQ